MKRDVNFRTGAEGILDFLVIKVHNRTLKGDSLDRILADIEIALNQIEELHLKLKENI